MDGGRFSLGLVVDGGRFSLGLFRISLGLFRIILELRCQCFGSGCFSQVLSNHGSFKLRRRGRKASLNEAQVTAAQCIYLEFRYMPNETGGQYR